MINYDQTVTAERSLPLKEALRSKTIFIALSLGQGRPRLLPVFLIADMGCSWAYYLIRRYRRILSAVTGDMVVTSCSRVGKGRAISFGGAGEGSPLVPSNTHTNMATIPSPSPSFRWTSFNMITSHNLLVVP